MFWVYVWMNVLVELVYEMDDKFEWMWMDVLLFIIHNNVCFILNFFCVIHEYKFMNKLVHYFIIFESINELTNFKILY